MDGIIIKAYKQSFSNFISANKPISDNYGQSLDSINPGINIKWQC